MKLATIGDGVDVCESLIANAGRGLFATRSFKKNQLITTYDGQVITMKEARTRSRQTHLASREGIVIDGITVPAKGCGGGSFANGEPLLKHSNAKIVAILGILALKSTRAIEPWEEIVVHYGRRGFRIACGTL